MSTYATNRFAGNGTTAQYEIWFAGGYIDKSHVKAYREDSVTLARTPVTISAGMFVGPYTLNLGPTAIGSTLVVYRDTPVDSALVDFSTGAFIAEANLDLVARQGVFAAAELRDLGVTGGGGTGPVSGVSSVNGRQGNVILSATDVGLGSIQADLDSKQPLLTSGTNIKTINGTSLLGAGNLVISGGGGGAVDSVNGQTGTVVLGKADVALSAVDNTADLNKPVSTATATALAAKQASLVSGTNIKTINGTSLLGSGNISISGGGTGGTTADITHTQPGTGGVVRTLSTLLSEGRVSVKNFGAVGDNVTDDTAAIKACIAYAKSLGRTVYFPAGSYLVTSTLLVDSGTSWEQFNYRLNIKGDGPSNTRIRMAGSFILLDIGGTAAERRLLIEGIYLQGPGYVPSGLIDPDPTPVGTGASGTGLRLQGLSYFAVRDVVSVGFEIGLIVKDTISGLFENTYVYSNVYGAQFLGGLYTEFNAITLESCAFGGNKVYGIKADNTITMTMNGGSIEANGAGGSGLYCGGLFLDLGSNGAVGASFNGVYFENNNGTADVYITNSLGTGTVNFAGCTFNRHNNTTKVQHNITVAPSSAGLLKVALTGCGFQGFNTYTPSALRAYIYQDGANASSARVSHIGCMFGAAVERPTLVPNYNAGELRALAYSGKVSGSGSVVTPAILTGMDESTSGSVYVAFDPPFKAGSQPLVFTQPFTAVTSPSCGVHSVTNNGCYINKWQLSGGIAYSGNWPVQWMAAGEAG